jgi:uncharacterized paraquat-inducible protein A
LTQQEYAARHRAQQEQRKSIPCLMCREMFPSSWAGERVCARCKTTTSWHDGHDEVFGVRVP